MSFIANIPRKVAIEDDKYKSRAWHSKARTKGSWIQIDIGSTVLWSHRNFGEGTYNLRSNIRTVSS